GEYVAPQSELEQQIAAIWADVLKLETVGLSDNFFELGGHSLLATSVIVRIQEQAGVAAELKELFEYPVLADFCRLLEGKAPIVDTTQDQLAKSLALLDSLSMEELDELIS
ncbi:phosphopantetheine-binding protein, partial [Pseudomonas putida]|uniref:phosphopantetheine-binding protein n=1 Tax=Pseudomonas putida TaxID=303 RepID=UPI0024E053C5